MVTPGSLLSDTFNLCQDSTGSEHRGAGRGEPSAAISCNPTTVIKGCYDLHPISEIRKQRLSEVARWARGLTAIKW